MITIKHFSNDAKRNIRTSKISISVLVVALFFICFSHSSATTNIQDWPLLADIEFLHRSENTNNIHQGKSSASQLLDGSIEGEPFYTSHRLPNSQNKKNSQFLLAKLIPSTSKTGNVSSSTKSEAVGGIVSIPFKHIKDRPFHRIPAIIRTHTGRLFAAVEARHVLTDHAEKEVIVVHSDNFGESWTKPKIIGDIGSDPTGNPVFIFDEQVNRLILFYASYRGDERSATNRRMFYRYSDDNGDSWSDRIEVTQLIPEHYSLALPGPGHGIQMKHKHTGRLVMPFWGYRDELISTIAALYSDDHGKSWQLGYESVESESRAYEPNEHQVIEQENGNLLIIARTAITDTEFGSGMVRAKAISRDGGQSMGPLVHSSQFSGPVVMGSVIRMNERLLYSSPLNSSHRKNMGIRESFNSGQSFDFPVQLSDGFSAYSDLVQIDEDTFGILYEVNGHEDVRFETYDISKLNTVSTALKDQSPNNSKAHLVHHKNAGNARIIANGRFGKAAELDGGSYIYIAKDDNNLLGDSDFSINFWYKSSRKFRFQESLLWFFTLGAARDAFWSRLLSSGIRTLVNSGGEKLFEHDTNIARDNNWHMMSLVRKGTTLYYYSDGERIFRLNNFFHDSPFGKDTDLGYYIGARPDNRSPMGTSEHFHGAIDEFRMYKRAISEEEVKRLFIGKNIAKDELVVALLED